MARRFKQHHGRPLRFTSWVLPTMKGYKLACCGCNLVHTLEFQAFKVTARAGSAFRYRALCQERYGVAFRVKPNFRDTYLLRRPPLNRHNDAWMNPHTQPGPVPNRRKWRTRAGGKTPPPPRWFYMPPRKTERRNRRGKSIFPL